MEETTGNIMEDNRCWYVAYTSVKGAKRVKESLDKAQIENFLPLQSVVRLWNEREKEIMVPVIPGCLFVRVLKEEIEKIASDLQISFLLNQDGLPVRIANEEMRLFDSLLGYAGEFVEFVPAGMQSGVHVRVTGGQMKGQTGELVECEGQTKLVVRLGSLGCALVDMPADKVEPCK